MPVLDVRFLRSLHACVTIIYSAKLTSMLSILSDSHSLSRVKQRWNRARNGGTYQTQTCVLIDTDVKKHYVRHEPQSTYALACQKDMQPIPSPLLIVGIVAIPLPSQNVRRKPEVLAQLQKAKGMGISRLFGTQASIGERPQILR